MKKKLQDTIAKYFVVRFFFIKKKLSYKKKYHLYMMDFLSVFWAKKDMNYHFEKKKEWYLVVRLR